MMLIRSLFRIIAGFFVGVFLSLVVGVFYGFAVWDPPSNDWGNEKDLDGILLAPVVLIILVIAILMRRRILSGLRAILSLGAAGYIAIVAGALIGPVAQLAMTEMEWRQAQADLPVQNETILKQLAIIGRELKAAKSVVVTEPPIITPRELERLYFRIALYTSRPVYLLISKDNKDAILREFRIETGDRCQQPNSAEDGGKPQMPLMTGDKCLTHLDMTDVPSFPADGILLSFPEDEQVAMYGFRHRDEQQRDLNHFMAVYHDINMENLQKANPPSSKYPYVENWTDPSQLKLHWQNWCSTKTGGAFPFASGIHWQLCTNVRSFPDILDRIFGHRPEFH